MNVKQALINLLRSAGFSIPDDIDDYDLVRRAQVVTSAFSESDTVPNLISLEMYESLVLNSYERDEIYQQLDNRALAHVIAYTLEQCQRRSRPTTTYEDAIKLLAEIAIPRLCPSAVESRTDRIRKKS